MSPRTARAAERRPQILLATSRVIGRRGIDGTRLADVAREAGVSVGSIQHHFGTRDRLLAEAVAYEIDRATDRWLGAGAAAEAGDAWSQLLALIDVVFGRHLFRERWTRWIEFCAAAARDPGLRAEIGAMYDDWRAPIRQAIEAGIASGVFRPRMSVDDVVDRTVAGFDGFALQVLLEAPGMSRTRMRALLIASVADYLGVASPEGNGRSSSRS